MSVPSNSSKKTASETSNSGFAGWIECVGCADRSAYDLTVHAKRTGEALAVRETRHQPLSIEEWHVELNKKKIGPAFRQNAKAVVSILSRSLFSYQNTALRALNVAWGVGHCD